ncbi:hypothetical protein J5N97_025906 [Dioscorea zingiberensis]|uniref:Uncharacterized protein n=1 Tax=Dioscorea zingiberensis TaxID=325984 RepID=A0A9D5C2G8_9LILI|nr:hypothetical protein J5N97_025906 [Dioscorea zingiberensis]
MGSTPVAEFDHLVLDELPEQDKGTAELIDEAAQIADIVLHSATQFMVRHTDVHGGCIGGPENLISIVCLYHNVVGGVSNPNAAYKIIEDHWCGVMATGIKSGWRGVASRNPVRHSSDLTGKVKNRRMVVAELQAGSWDCWPVEAK